MATLREIRRRIGSIKNTQKITKAMKMVAAAKLRRAQEQLLAARPYARTMNGLMRHLMRKVDPSLHPLLQARDVRRVLVVVVSSDRGMCGAFNTSITKTAVEHVRNLEATLPKSSDAVRLLVIGRKATDFFSKRNYALFARHSGFFQALNTGQARGVVDEIVQGYLNGMFDRVDVVYNEFKNVLQQRLVVEQFLPIVPEEIVEQGLRALAQVDYIYEPSSELIVRELLPKHLNFQMWRILLESNTAEEGARMTAMGNATENAKELLTELTLSYNKARQAGITKELLEIVSGAEALKKTG